MFELYRGEPPSVISLSNAIPDAIDGGGGRELEGEEIDSYEVVNDLNNKKYRRIFQSTSSENTFRYFARVR